MSLKYVKDEDQNGQNSFGNGQYSQVHERIWNSESHGDDCRETRWKLELVYSHHDKDGRSIGLSRSVVIRRDKVPLDSLTK